MNSWNALKADTHRQYGYFSSILLCKGASMNRTFRPVVTMRLCQRVASSPRLIRYTLPFFKILHRIATHHAAMDFSWQTKIGAGLALTHGWGLVVSRGVKIGNNVTLFHGVTLGRSDKISIEHDHCISST